MLQGAGEAGTGIAELLAFAIASSTGQSLEQSRRRIFLVDHKGLVTAERARSEGDSMPHHKLPFAHPTPAGCPEGVDFTAIVEALRPSAIIGVSAQPGAFSEPVIRAMAKINARPVIFALSNPTSKSECTAEQAYTWTEGKAVFASGV